MSRVSLLERAGPAVAPYLNPGEELQVVFQGQTVSAWFGVAHPLAFAATKQRVVVVTDKRILVCKPGYFPPRVVTAVIRELPRATRFGPPDGLWFKSDALGETLHFHRKWHRDIAHADELTGFSAA